MTLVAQNVRIIDDEGRVLDLDESTFAQKFVDYPHHENHEGRLYGAWVRDTLSIGDQVILAFHNASSADQMASDPSSNAREMHLVWRASGLSGAGNVAAYDACSLDINSLGVAFTPHNHNHASGNTSVGSCYQGALLQNTGTIADLNQFGSGNNTPGESRGEAEHVIPPGDCFVIILESEGNTNPCLIHTVHYEHPKKR